MGKKSQSKGVKGETEAVRMLEKACPGSFAYRSGVLQGQGKDSWPDVVHNLFPCESKLKAVISIADVKGGLAQVTACSTPGQFPIVRHRAARETALVTMSEETFIALALVAFNRVSFQKQKGEEQGG